MVQPFIPDLRHTQSIHQMITRMKTLLFSIFLLCGLGAFSQTGIPGKNCKAYFKYEVNDKMMFPYAATAINFYDLSEGKVKEWYWDFGEGNTSREQNPLFIFKHPVSSPNVKINPYRNVSLTILTDSCKSFYSITINILDGTQYIPEQCYAYFGYSVNYSIQTFAPALVLDFYAKYPENVTTWKWDFGDGTTSEEPKPTHIFNLPLRKDSLSANRSLFRKVTLTIATEKGCTATWSDSINLYMNTIPVDTIRACHAWFKYYQAGRLGSDQQTVPFQFRDASQGKVVRRLWQFESGETSTMAEPIVRFSIFRPAQKVCLTIYTADSCKNTWCETVYVSQVKIDSSHVNNKGCNYSMQIISGFPEQMSSCAGYAHARVYLKDSVVKAVSYTWSNGASGQVVTNLCPTRTYTVKAQTEDGCIVSCNFIFNSDGTVTEIPISWWFSGSGDNQNIKYNITGKNFTVEWQLPDGTIVKSDTVPLNSVSGGIGEINLIVRDSLGHIVYNEKISVNNSLTGIQLNQTLNETLIFPNPVSKTLHILYSGSHLNELLVEITDISGRIFSARKFHEVVNGQQIDMDVSTLGKGIFFCRMIPDHQNRIVKKFIK
jgi:hypothetical protein